MNSVEVASDHFENLTTKKYYITSNLMYAQGKDHSASEGVGDLENKCPVSALCNFMYMASPEKKFLVHEGKMYTHTHCDNFPCMKGFEKKTCSYTKSTTHPLPTLEVKWSAP